MGNLIKVTAKSRLCCLINFEHRCFNCDTRLCTRHYNYYSKKCGNFNECRSYDNRDWCHNEVCPPCGKVLKKASGSVRCKTHMPLSTDIVFRCYNSYYQEPIRDLKKHLDRCEFVLVKHVVGVRDFTGHHRPATKEDLIEVSNA